MQTTRVALEAEIIRRARVFADCFDGFEHDTDPKRYIAWHNLSVALVEYDHLEPGELDAPSHTANANGPETEHQAAVLAQFKKKGTSALICDNMIIAFRGGYIGLTDDELEAKHRVGKPHSTTSSARNWLMNHGWLRNSGFRRRTRTGGFAIVWELTPAAWEKLTPS